MILVSCEVLSSFVEMGLLLLDEPLGLALLPQSACGRVAQMVRAEVS